MANTVYDNFVLESVLNDNLKTKLNANNWMTIDNSLVGAEGDFVKVVKYTYSGEVEKLAKGAKNTDSKRGSITTAATNYTIKCAQEVFDYADEDTNKDSKTVEYGMKGASNLMVNDMVNDFFTEIAKATLSQTYTKGGAISYETVVDAIAKMNLEDESGLMLLIGNDLKAQIRKDADFKSKELGKVIADGAIGTLSGVPVICSKAVPAKTAYLFTKEAVTCYMKKDSEVEQDRDKEARSNTVILRTYDVIALTDATKVVKITEALA